MFLVLNGNSNGNERMNGFIVKGAIVVGIRHTMWDACLWRYPLLKIRLNQSKFDQRNHYYRT